MTILLYGFAVAPLVGAWIEISSYTAVFGMIQSRPSWARGLK